jgi:hypothetical protein
MTRRKAGTPPSGSCRRSSSPTLAPAHLRLAVIADRRGDSDAAAAHRAAYEDLWFDADSLARAALNP